MSLYRETPTGNRDHLHHGRLGTRHRADQAGSDPGSVMPVGKRGGKSQTSGACIACTPRRRCVSQSAIALRSRPAAGTAQLVMSVEIHPENPGRQGD